MSEAGIDPRAGQLPETADLVLVERLLATYYEQRPDPSDPLQRVAFGTSGHRGSSLSGTFTDAHVAAISEAVCRYREGEGIDGPLYLGRDTHALSEPAFRTIVECSRRTTSMSSWMRKTPRHPRLLSRTPS